MDMHGVHKLCLGAMMVCAVAVSTAQADLPRDEQRHLFMKARDAVERNDVASYTRLEPLLRDYPLYPYLRYQYLRKRLAYTPAAEVRTFLSDYADSPLANQLRRAWLSHLAQRGRWQDLVHDYTPGLGTAHYCLFLHARIRSGAGETVWEDIDALWLTGSSLPDECDEPIAAWRKTEKFTHEKVLARIELAIQKGQSGLVRYLTGLLPKEERAWIQRWQQMHRSPESQLKNLRPNASPFWSAKLYSYGVRRLADKDADAAARRFESHALFQLTSEQIFLIERSIALGMARQRHPDAVSWLTRVAQQQNDKDVRHWRVRAALWQLDWPEVLAAVDALPPEESTQEEWQYWRARALEQLARVDEAYIHYENVANQRSYFGFLAAARLGRTPNITNVSLDISAERLEALRYTPAMARVRELQAVGMTVEARREWREAIDRLDEDGLQVAAKLAYEWGWFDQAILALGRTAQRHDLELRFPTPYQEEVLAAAAKRGIDPAFIFAVMRQESAFGVDARSRVGALGLMQLMPGTARITAQAHRLPLRSHADLLKADHNIRLGTAHLSDLLERYGGSRLFALAAYNAGPGHVERWRPAHEPKPADVWVANITFGETREYVQRILTYTTIYEWRLGHEVTPMDNWLHTVEPRFIREAGQGQTIAPPG